MKRDEFIAMKMVTRSKEIAKFWPKNTRLGIEQMLGLLEASRDAAIEYDTAELEKIVKRPTAQELYDESCRICGDCFDPVHARTWAHALARP